MELYFLFLLIAIMVFALTSGFPVAFSLPGSAIAAVAIAAFCGWVFEGNVDAYFVLGGPNQWLSAGVTNYRSLYWDVERDTLIAIPLFIFMGIMLQRSKIAEDLLVAMAQLFGPIPGGLGISVVFVGALLAATTGIVGATVIAMGLISLPAMLRNNYSKSLACGTICASGTLGQIIPPSIVLVLLGDVLSNALIKRGFSVEVARTTDEAIELVSINIPDYAIIDLRIGEQSGLTLVEHLHQKTKQTRTVVLTGYGSIATAVEAIKKGAQQYLTKPTAVDDIVAALTGDEAESEKVLAVTRRPSVKRLEWEHIQNVLNENNGNISATARALGMHRRTLQRKLQKYPVRD